MENASKAILMAGGMLIAILIVSLLIFAWDTFSNYYSRKDSIDEIEDVTEFNLQFSNYDRKNVDGYDLFSLINKCIDYNTRRTTWGRENSYNYTPIKITVYIDPEQAKLELSSDGNNLKLFDRADGKYILGDNTKILETIVSEIKDIEQNVDFGGNANLTNLTKHIKTIYDVTLTGTPEEQKQQKIDIIKEVDAITSYKLPFESDSEIISSYQKIKDNELNVRKYYEYVYFKKAKFDSDSAEVKYDMTTGRIIEMYFTYKT